MHFRSMYAAALILTLAFPLAAGSAEPQRAGPPTATIGPAAFIRPAPEGYRFPNGMIFHYEAEWRLLKAGTATLRLDAAGPEQRVSVTADTIGVVTLLYRIQDQFESYFDRRSFCSLSLSKHSEEGLHKRQTVIRFDQTRRKALLDERNLRNGETKHTERDIPGCVTDVFSGVYYIASLPLEPGSNYIFPLNDGGQTVDVRARVEAREEIKTDAGTFRTVRVQPESDSGVLKERGQVWLWYTDDPSHMLVQMRTRLLWGSLYIRLVRVEREGAHN